MTLSSVVVSFETKRSPYIISANESDLGTNIVVSVQTARNAVKSTSGSRTVVQVTKGQCAMCTPLSKRAGGSKVYAASVNHAWRSCPGCPGHDLTGFLGLVTSFDS